MMQDQERYVFATIVVAGAIHHLSEAQPAATGGRDCAGALPASLPGSRLGQEAKCGD
ncbi:MAG: hypothetical protein ACYC5O_02005 [Anaerolineae bacterium]